MKPIRIKIPLHPPLQKGERGGFKKRDFQVKRLGQSVLEYALIVTVVAAALGAMQTYVQRSVQANLKMIENRINAR